MVVFVRVIRWVPSFICVLMIGPQHLKRAHRQHLASEVLLPLMSSVLTVLLVSSVFSWGVSPLDPEPLTCLLSCTGEVLDGLTLGLSSDSQVLKQPGS